MTIMSRVGRRIIPPSALGVSHPQGKSIPKPTNKPIVPPKICTWDFIEQERSDPRYTVVFDLDKTLVATSADIVKGLLDGSNIVLVRSNALELLKELKEKGIKIVIWSKGGRNYVIDTLKEAKLYDLCDVIITREAYWNYEGFDNLEKDQKRFEETFGKDAARKWSAISSQGYGMGFAKYIDILGYDVLIDDEEAIKIWSNDPREVPPHKTQDLPEDRYLVEEFCFSSFSGGLYWRYDARERMRKSASVDDRCEPLKLVLGEAPGRRSRFRAYRCPAFWPYYQMKLLVKKGSQTESDNSAVKSEKEEMRERDEAFTRIVRKVIANAGREIGI